MFSCHSRADQHCSHDVYAESPIQEVPLSAGQGSDDAGQLHVNALTADMRWTISAVGPAGAASSDQEVSSCTLGCLFFFMPR